MELKQTLADVKKDAHDNEKALEHWQGEHDKLQLIDIECVSFWCIISHTDPSLCIVMTMTMMRTRQAV